MSEQVGQLIKRARETKRYSLRLLGEEVGVSHTTLSMIEKGKQQIPFNLIDKLSKVLELDRLNLYIEAGYTPPELLFDLDPEVENYLKDRSIRQKEYVEEIEAVRNELKEAFTRIKQIQNKLSDDDINAWTETILYLLEIGVRPIEAKNAVTFYRIMRPQVKELAESHKVWEKSWKEDLGEKLSDSHEVWKRSWKEDKGSEEEK